MSHDPVALLFTDIEGSTRLLDRLGVRFEEFVEEHDRLVRDAIAASARRRCPVRGLAPLFWGASTVSSRRCAEDVF